MKLLLLALLGPAWLFAQDAPPGDLMGWLTGSAVTVLAAVVWGFLRRWIVTGTELQREIDRAERAEAKVDQLRDYIEERTLPALIRVTDVLSRGVDAAAANAVTPIPRRTGDEP